ncbi:NAD(P)-dependent oxidoreductase [Paenibacillus sp. tmac-D7]|uniref:NAD(P)-dependent oxidoreductase n=1 Tax=Paenibacillus sp. tmac-D7 TaxID=2591462 RepID=UPI00114510B7|nr:NAD(P)-dependent oxidoreductase [Paenibacillus sp. tmac-D7]
MGVPRIGFIGFGEAAFHISSGLWSEGIEQIVAFDAMLEDLAYGPLIKERAQAAHVSLVSSLQQLIESSDVILCATSAKYAVKIAEDAVKFVKDNQLYADLNSASPTVKKEIATIIGASGALLVDAAVMEAVPPYRHKVPISVSGNGASRFADLMGAYGMNITVINDKAGSSSAMKMVRSVFMKGFTALLLETLSAAHKSGVEREIIQSIGGTLSDRSIVELANLLITRTAVHAERRVAEMEEVTNTLRELNLDFAISAATKIKLQHLVDLDLKLYFNGNAPERYEQVLEAINEISQVSN